MRFENFISALDMGQCEDQLQRQCLFDLALMFVMIDGVVTSSEEKFMENWLKEIPWSSEQSKEEYYKVAMDKCKRAMESKETDDFIAHRARQIIDPCARQQALQLAEQISHVDGELDEREASAIKLLTDLLECKH